MAIIDENMQLTISDIATSDPVKFERKATSDFIWAQDVSHQCATVEKTRMFIFEKFAMVPVNNLL